MKKLLLLSACSLTLLATAQNTVNISSQQYDALKQNHQLDLTKQYKFTDAVSTTGNPIHFQGTNRSSSSICSCMIPLDTTFSVVPFSFTSVGAPDYRNDDGYSDTINLPFSFNFYGTNYDGVIINNNGNISFNHGYSSFTSTGFPSNQYSMIAPFWADVDTRNDTSGLVYYKITPTALIVKWDNVGYFPSKADKLNTFQLVITNGADTLLPAGDNVGFCYGDMQWTTGSASGGVAGFGGTSSTVGVNKGDSINFFQIGRFDTAGVAFDGPYGATDQVDWLDNQGMYFSVSTASASSNVPPIIINNNICDTIDVFTGDTVRTMSVDSVMFSIGVTTPEQNQVVSAAISSTDPDHLTYNLAISSPTYKRYDCVFNVVGLTEGIHKVTITATDNGVPAAQTTTDVVIRSNYATTTGIQNKNTSSFINLYPNPTTGSLTVKHNFSLLNKPMLAVTNVIGQNVLSAQLTSNEQTIDISKLDKGVYFATITSGDGVTKTIKLVKK